MRRFPYRVAAGLFAAMTMAGLMTAITPAFAPAASAQTSTGVSYSGDAYAIGLKNVTILGSAVNNGALLGDTGQLPATGGTVNSPLGTVTLPASLGTVTVTGGTVTGAGGAATASEKVAGVSLLDNLTGSLLGATTSSLGNLPLLGSTLSGLLGSGALSSSGTSSSSGLGLLSGILGLGGSSSSSSSSGSSSCSGLLSILSELLGGCSSSSSSSSGVTGSLGDLLQDPLGALVDVGLVQTAAGAAAPGVSPVDGTTYPFESSNIGTIDLLGGAVAVPINPAPNTVINLGILSITLNQQSYDPTTNTASAQAIVLNFPTSGLLSAVITGTITISSSTADTSGTLTCPSGLTVSSITPTSGPLAGGTHVTISGTGFASGAAVSFGSTPATDVTVASSSSITATSPAHATGSVPVEVNSCPSTTDFTYTGAPATRFGGGNRIETAIAVSQGAYPTAGSAKAVVLASDLDYTDGLSAVPLASEAGGPLLLTEPTSEKNGLDSQVEAEIERVLTPHANKPVYIIGGYGTLAQSIDTTLSGLGYDPIREAGSDAPATAVAVAKAQSNPNTVFLATDTDFADGLSAGPAAVHQNGVILYTNGSTMAPETRAYLSAHPGDAVFAVGGPAHAADPGATPIVGANEFATDTLVAAFFGNPSVIGVARGDLFPDALDGGTMVATDGGPIILVNPNLPIPTASQTYFTAEKPYIQAVNVYGGTGAVSDAVVSAINTDLGD